MRHCALRRPDASEPPRCCWCHPGKRKRQRQPCKYLLSLVVSLTRAVHKPLSDNCPLTPIAATSIAAAAVTYPSDPKRRDPRQPHCVRHHGDQDPHSSNGRDHRRPLNPYAATSCECAPRSALRTPCPSRASRSPAPRWSGSPEFGAARTVGGHERRARPVACASESQSRHVCARCTCGLLQFCAAPPDNSCSSRLGRIQPHR